MSAEIILLNPSYVFPPFAPEDLKALKSDPIFMDLPSEEFLYPPIGLLSIGGALKRDGFSVELYDCNTRAQPIEEVARHCAGAKVVGISLLVANLHSTWRLVKALKRVGVEVVLGGAYPTIEPQIVAKMGLRYGIAGEGEVSFPALCRALIRGQGRPEDVDGVIIAEPDAPEVFTRPPVLLEDLNELLPDRSLLTHGTYKLPFTGKLQLALASRGCPFSCTFCYCSSASPSSMFNKSRWVDVDVIVRDIMDTARRFRPAYMEMIDETFTVNRKYVLELCQALVEAGFDIPWGAKTRMDIVDEELIEAMSRAGLRKLGFGLESGVYDHRRAMKKDFTDRKVEEVVAATHKHGVEPACTIIFGHPDETRADMQQSVEMVKALRFAYVEFHIMVLIPGTKLFDRALSEGKVTADVFDRFMRGECGYPEYAPCLLYTSPSPRDGTKSRMPSSA